ncbi:MAG: hypothetical protein IKD78_10200, partial [Bacteroidales bacterium]|nr:hypothetical protein [Bacteroidales bacterium]
MKDDYPNWDGHILLDLDGKPNPIYDTIYNLLVQASPQWMRLVKKSGSGTLHILCHTEVGAGQKTKLNFESAFDTFSSLLLQFLQSNHITLGNDITIDRACRKISQGMAFWNTPCVLNQNNTGFDIFQTQEFAQALQMNTVAEQKKKRAQNIRKSQKKIAASVTSKNYDFTYSTANAVEKVWQTKSGKDHAPYKDRLAVVIALHTLGVSEDETYDICCWGFPENHREEVRKWYQSADVADSIAYLERNLSMLKKYLENCKIQYTLQPIIKLDKSVRMLFPVKYNTHIRLNAKEYIINILKQPKGIEKIFTTYKDIIFLDAGVGTGKTELAKFLMRQGKRVCYACGRNTVLKNKFNGMDIIRCYSIHTQTADLTNKKKSLCCSLNWLANNFEKVEDDFDYIVIDEIHLTDESFRKELMLDLLGHIRNYANNKHSRTKLLLMTGTPSIEVNYLDPNKTHFVKVVKNAQSSKTIIPCVSNDYKSAITAMIDDIEKAKAAGKKVLICENDTKRNAVLADYFERGGIKLVDFNRKQRHSEEVDYVLANSRIPDGYDGIVVTTYFGVGCEIKDRNEWEVFFMPLQNRGFCAGHIEQFSNRVRGKNITARIYFHGMLNMGAADADKVKNYNPLSKQKHEEYENILNQCTASACNIDMKEIVEALVRYIDSKEVEYDTYTYQSAIYEFSLGTVMSLLRNEYGWHVEESKYTAKKSAVKELQESKQRMSDEEGIKYKKACDDMYREYCVPFVGEEKEKTVQKLWNIHNGIREYEEELYTGIVYSVVEDGAIIHKKGSINDVLKEKGRVCYFHPKCEYEPKYYNEYHQEIAGYIAEFGER